MFKKQRSGERGFLLVEVLVSLVILAIVGMVIINSLSSQSLQSSKNSVKSESTTRLSSAADVISSAPFSPCTSQSPNQNPYSSYSASISPVTIVAIYGITSSNQLAYCLQRPELLTAKLDFGLVDTAWPTGESGTARVQKIILYDPATKLTRSVVKTFDSKATSYGLGGAFRTVIRSTSDNSQITNVIMSVGTTQTFKLDVLPVRPETETIRYLITQGSSGPNSSPAVNASISGNILTISIPEILSDRSSNISGRAKIDVEGFDVDAALLAYPAGIGITVKIPPPSGAVLLSQVILTSGVSATPFKPVAASGIASPFIYSISPTLPAGLAMDSTTGTISGTPASSLTSTTYSVTIQDKNNATSDPSSFILRIISPLTSTLGVLMGQTLYTGGAITSFTPLSLSGGNQPYNFTISPSLPSGLRIDSATGVISGTPTAVYSQNSFTVTGTDSVITGYSGQSATNTFNIRILDPLSATPTSITWSLTKNVAINQATVTPSGGVGPYTFSKSSGTIPAGLTLNSSTGYLSGTPTNTTSKAVVYTFTLLVTDSLTPTALTKSISVSITVSK